MPRVAKLNGERAIALGYHVSIDAESKQLHLGWRREMPSTPMLEFLELLRRTSEDACTIRILSSERAEIASSLVTHVQLDMRVAAPGPTAFRVCGIVYPVRPGVSWDDIGDLVRQVLQGRQPASEEKRNLEFHIEFQRQLRLAPHLRNDAQQALWCRMLEIVDFKEYEARNPRMVSRVGRVTKKTRTQISIEWSGETEQVYEALAHSALIDAKVGDTVEARLRRVGPRIEWLECHVGPPLREDRDVRERFEQLAQPTSALPKGKWPRRAETD